MTTTNNVVFGSGAGPSGSAVESAAFHPETDTSGIARRIGHLRSSATRAVQSLRSTSVDKIHHVQDVAGKKKLAARDAIDAQVTNARDSMRVNPMKWASIAVGSGLAIGLAGRFLHWRANRPTQHFVIIDAACT